MGAKTVVSEDEEEYDEDNIRHAFDIEAAEAGGEEDEEEEHDDYEKDDFIVDVEDELGVGSSEEIKASKKKKKKREAEGNYELDEEDYHLLQEANVTGFNWSKPGKKQFKRLKKAGKNNDIGAKTSFFHDNEMEDGMLPDDLVEEEDQLEEEDMEEEDEMADFIVDDEEMDANDLPVRSRRSKKGEAKQARGISSSDLKKTGDTFGGVNKRLTRQKKGLKVKGLDEGLVDDLSSKSLEDEFEPSILAEKYMTGKDDQIRETDLPERFQLSEEISGPYPQNEDTLPEAKWIYERVFGSLAIPMRKEFQHITELDKEEVVKEISNVLQMCHDLKLEVPFIAMYRKELCLKLLQDQEDDYIESADNDSCGKLRMYKALWAIDFWDRKWILLKRRKNALKAAYEKRAQEEASRDPIKLRLLDSILQSLDNAESERTVDDIDAKFNLHFPPDEAEVEQGQFKRPSQKSMYSICRKSGLAAVTKEFGLTAEQLGKNLSLKYKWHEIEDNSSMPDDVAAKLLSGELKDPQTVLKGARHMVAVEISCEPAVKEFVRLIYMEQAVLSTRPTDDGKNRIDDFHQYAGVKWLLEKPIRMFDNAEWLLIQKAEVEKLLQVTICLSRDALEKSLMSEFEIYYLSHGATQTAQLWNEQRKLILKDALCNYILPGMEKEARMVLSMRAKCCLVEDYKAQLWKKVSFAPYQHSEENAGTCVMSCCQGSGKDPTTFVMLDASGEVLDIFFSSYLSARSKNPDVQKRKENDWQRLSKFIMDQRPHVVVLGASNIRCKYLKDDMEAKLKVANDCPDDPAEGVDSLVVVYADESIPRLYEMSRISQDQLPKHSGIVRRAVALGRYLQNPLAMVATLCGPGREILSLKLHSLEHFLSTDDRYEGAEQVMITVTNQVGVDINLASSHEWMFAPLQFIAGLGPRKATSMQKAISRVGRVYSRRELLTLGAVKRLVFINAVGFLRVRGTGQAASSSQVMDPFDDTRIHPESYELAKKMVKDVYCKDVGQDIDDMDEVQQNMAIKHIKSHPHLLKALDINDYAKNVEQQSDNKRQETLCYIKFELLHGFQDWRLPYRQPDADEQFLMLTGESEETLPEGKIVQATVRRVLDQHVFCNLESGITGRIAKDDLSDGTGIDHVEQITEGSILTCRVKSVQKERYSVDLSCKLSELSDQFRSRQDRDCYYANDEFILRSEQEKAQKEKEHPKKSFKSRTIAHPQFQNISESDAIKNLSDKDAGESIIRPSSKGPSYLTLTLKVWDRVYAHKDIVEGGKDHRDFAGFLQIGKTLSIGDETFKGLDEVMARYVDPLVSNLKAILAYRKFRRGTKEEIDEALRKEKYGSPETIPHCISVSHERPGAFVLSYVKSDTPHHEYFGLYPKGFKFRKIMFDHLDDLVAYFQKHVNDLVQDPIRSVAAMVPKKSLGRGQSAGGGRDFGWQGHTGMDRERSSMPGSRKGESSFNRPQNGRGRGRRGGGGRGGSWNEGRGDGGRSGSWNEGRGDGGRGGNWNKGRGGGGRGGSRNEGRGSGGWNEGRGSGSRVSDSMDSGWGGGSGGGITNGGWGGGGSGDIADGGGWNGGGSGGRVNDSMDSGWGGGDGGVTDGGWGGGGSGGSIDSGWGAGGGGKSTDGGQGGVSADNVWGGAIGGGSGEGDKSEGRAGGTNGWGGTGGGGSTNGGWGGGTGEGDKSEGRVGGTDGGGSTDAGWGGGGGGRVGGTDGGGSTDAGWGGGGGGGGGSADAGWGGGGGGGGGSTDAGWGGGGGGGGGSTDGGWGGVGGGSMDGSWGGGRGGGSRDGGWGGGSESWGVGGGSEGMDGGWGGGGGGGNKDGGWGRGRGGGSRDGACGGGRGGGWGGGKGNGGNRDGSSGRGGRGRESRDGAWGRGGGGQSEGRGGGFGRTKNEGRFGSNRGRWNEDKGNRWGRNSGRGRGRGSERGSPESTFNSRQQQCSGSNTNYGSFSHKQERDVWGSKEDGWGNNSSNSNSKSPSKADWISGSGENGKNRQGSNGWDAGELSEGWNSLTVSDIDATSKDKTSGWDTVSKAGSSEMSGAEAGVPGVAWGGTEGAKTNDSWCITEALKSNIGWAGSGTEGKNDEWAMHGVGTENNGGASGWAKDSDGWAEAMAVGSVNTGGSGWES